MEGELAAGCREKAEPPGCLLAQRSPRIRAAVHIREGVCRQAFDEAVRMLHPQAGPFMDIAVTCSCVATRHPGGPYI